MFVGLTYCQTPCFSANRPLLENDQKDQLPNLTLEQHLKCTKHFFGNKTHRDISIINFSDLSI